MVVAVMATPLLWPPPSAVAGDLLFKPSVSLSEEITDNIFEQSTNKRSEYMTRLTPGATFHYISPLWTWDTTYSFEFRT